MVETRKRNGSFKKTEESIRKGIATKRKRYGKCMCKNATEMAKKVISIRRERYGKGMCKNPIEKGRKISEAMKNGSAVKGLETKRKKIGKYNGNTKESYKKMMKTRVERYGKSGCRNPKERTRKIIELSRNRYGKHMCKNPEERSRKARMRTGEKSHNYHGGVSFELYGLEFDKKLKEVIRKRDNYRCQQCFRHQDELFTKNGKKYNLVIHHVDYNKRNNDSNNLISLCRNCHAQVGFRLEKWTKYFQAKITGAI